MVIAELLAVLTFIADFADDHPEIVKALANGAKKLLGVDKLKEATIKGMSAGQQTAVAAGLASIRANAVQEALRKISQLNKTPAVVA